MTVRFAPSPTGRFHIGNLRTAWISQRLAQELGLPWWVRFEDIDSPRVVPGAREQQLRDLSELGLTPDHLEIQSTQLDLHWRVFLELLQTHAIFPCTCSRREVQEELAQLASAPQSSSEGLNLLPPAYSGHCLRKTPSFSPGRPIAWRIQPTGVLIARTHTADLEVPAASPQSAGFEPAYHWACAIDDARGDPEHQILVRAWDLAEATPIQRSIQKHWKGPHYLPPAVFHTSLVVQESGRRLEKRTQGITLPEWIASGNSLKDLLRAFEASFSLPDPSELDRGMLSGEKHQKLRLSALMAHLSL